ncbi:hypothetical protein Tco_0273058 [Tanacetum coccineum]
MCPRFVQLCLDMQRHKLQQHTKVYSVPSLTMKVFSNLKRITKGFSGQEVALFPNMLAVPTPSASPSNNISSPEPTPTQPSPTQPSPQPSPIQPSPTQLSPTQPGSEYHSPTPQTHLSCCSHHIQRKPTNLAYTNLILRRVKKLRGTDKVEARIHILVLAKISKKGPVSEEVLTVSTAEATLSTAGGTVTYSRRSAEKRSRKDKGKAILIEEEPKKKSKKDLEQEQLSYAEAIRLEEQMNEEQRAQIARDAEIARQWDEEERKRAMDAAKSTEKIDWNDPSVIRYHSLKMKPKSIAQARRNMIKYLKNQGNYKITDFKGMSYNDIRPIFEKIWDFNQNIKPMDEEQGSKKQKSPEKERSTEKIVEEEAVTQGEREEVVKEPAAKRKKRLMYDLNFWVERDEEAKLNGIICDHKRELVLRHKAEDGSATEEFKMPWNYRGEVVCSMVTCCGKRLYCLVGRKQSLKEEKMYVKFFNNVEAEQRGSYLDVEGIEWVMSRSWHCRKEQTIS